MTVREEVQQRIEQDPELIRLRKKIKSDKATYADTAAYSNRAGKLLGEVFSRRLPEIPPEEREPLCVELLHDRYIDINAAVDTAQRFMDEALGIHIAPQHAPFDSERGHQIGSSLRDLSKPLETLQRRSRAATETATKAIHDDRMKAESKFRHRVGLDCRITRVAVNGCCPWCRKVAGRYVYGEEPDDIYRRHDNCDCTVTFENGRKRQDVWSKREWEAPGKDAGADDAVVLTKEQAAAIGAGEPIRLTQEQARTAGAREPVRFTREQASDLHERLTNGRSSGTMKLVDSIELFNGSQVITGDQRNSLDEALSPVPKKLLQKLSEYINEIQVVDGRGFNSYNRESRDIILDKDSGYRSVLHEIGHAFGDMLDLYNNPDFLTILSDGIDISDYGNVMSMKHPFIDGEYVYILSTNSPKFISKYQARVYIPDMLDVDLSAPIELSYFREYISVAFDTYFSDPDLLRSKDPRLFHYLEGIINGYA